MELTPEVMTTNARLYADEEYGMFEKTEIWRRDVFQQWALDKGPRPLETCSLWVPVHITGYAHALRDVNQINFSTV